MVQEQWLVSANQFVCGDPTASCCRLLLLLLQVCEFWSVVTVAVGVVLYLALAWLYAKRLPAHLPGRWRPVVQYLALTLSSISAGWMHGTCTLGPGPAVQIGIIVRIMNQLAITQPGSPCGHCLLGADPHGDSLGRRIPYCVSQVSSSRCSSVRLCHRCCSVGVETYLAAALQALHHATGAGGSHDL